MFFNKKFNIVASKESRIDCSECISFGCSDSYNLHYDTSGCLGAFLFKVEKNFGKKAVDEILKLIRYHELTYFPCYDDSSKSRIFKKFQQIINKYKKPELEVEE